MLIIFDLDGTLITSYMDNVGKVFDHWTVLPGVRERLAVLLASGHQVALATNQAGVAFGFVTEADVERKLHQALDALGLSATTPVAVCYAHPKSRIPRYNDPAACARRKPGPAMLLELMEQAGVGESETLFVGDLGSDEQAAAAAGVGFQSATDFFGASQDG